MKNTIAILGIATLATTAVPQLHAGHVSVSFGLPLPVPVFSVHAGVAPPVYVQSAPVYVQAAPVAPVCVPQPTVVYTQPGCVAPPVYYAPAPFYGVPRFGFNFRFGPAYASYPHSHWHH